MLKVHLFKSHQVSKYSIHKLIPKKAAVFAKGSKWKVPPYSVCEEWLEWIPRGKNPCQQGAKRKLDLFPMPEFRKGIVFAILVVKLLIIRN